MPALLCLSACLAAQDASSPGEKYPSGGFINVTAPKHTLDPTAPDYVTIRVQWGKGNRFGKKPGKAEDIKVEFNTKKGDSATKKAKAIAKAIDDALDSAGPPAVNRPFKAPTPVIGALTFGMEGSQGRVLEVRLQSRSKQAGAWSRCKKDPRSGNVGMLRAIGEFKLTGAAFTGLDPDNRPSLVMVGTDYATRTYDLTQWAGKTPQQLLAQAALDLNAPLAGVVTYYNPAADPNTLYFLLTIGSAIHGGCTDMGVMSEIGHGDPESYGLDFNYLDK